MSLRATHAIIDLWAIRDNMKKIREILPHECKILVVVKGNAYGLGAVPISRMLERAGAGVFYLGVAALSEAVELRENNLNLPILLFTEPFIEEYSELLKHEVTQTVFSFEKAAELNIVAGALGTTSRIHIKVDTGMGRVGCPYESAFDIVTRVCSELKYTQLEGVYTHFPVAEEPDRRDNRAYTIEQIKKMNLLKDRISKAGINIPIYHCGNTGAVLNFPESAFDMVRVGISAYGCHPSSEGRRIDLKNVLTLKSKVIFVKRVPAGTSISYGREYITEKETTIATLPVGYADGYPLALSNKGKVLINGNEYQVAGRVCMDQCMIDIGDDEVFVDDEAILIGSQQGVSFYLEDVASILGTIPYEIMCGIAPRVPRIHIGIEGIDTSEV